MQYNELIEIEAGDKTPEKHDPKWQWAAFIISAIVFTVGVIGVVTFLDDSGSSNDLAVTTSPQETESQTPMLTQPQMCGTCQEIPGVPYTLCGTCWTPTSEPALLHCRSGERPVIEEVKLGGGRELPENAIHLAYTSCLATAKDDGDRFTCSYSLSSVQDENHVQTKYVCLSARKPAPLLSSAHFPDFPLLSSTEAHCGKVKPLYEGWDKGAACASTSGDHTISISCAQGKDTRLLVNKVKIHSSTTPVVLAKHGQGKNSEEGKHHKEKHGHNHEGNKNQGTGYVDKHFQNTLASRAVKLCDGKFETSSSCVFHIEDMYMSGESILEGDYQLSYVCSYPAIITVV